MTEPMWLDLLQTAAAELRAAAEASANIACRLRCLHAVEELESISPDLRTTAAAEGAVVGDRIEIALRALGELPPDIYADEHILNAASSARRALQHLA